MSKDDAISIMNGSNLVDKSGILYKNFFFSLYIKMGESTDLSYYQKSKDLILNKAKDYYENKKERLREQARNKYIKLI